MSRVTLSPVPSLGTKAAYTDYAPWLLENFYDRICAYCIAHFGILTVDHYQPQTYRPELTNEPTNLLPACGNCNGPGGKGDYHPRHGKRYRLKSDKSRFTVLDVRRDNLGRWYSIHSSGELRIQEGRYRKKAAWNAALLKLDCRHLQDRRAYLMKVLEACRGLLELESTRGSLDAPVRNSLDLLLGELAKNLLFFEIFEIPISKPVRALASKVRQDLKAMV